MGSGGSQSRPTALSPGGPTDTLRCSTQRVSACCPLPGDTDARMCGESVR